MRKPMRDYFKTEGDFVAFALLYMEGEQRTAILGITPSHYKDRDLARAWAIRLADLVTDNEEALRDVLRIYRRMIGDPEAELPRKYEGWVFEYLERDGKNLETLEKALTKMSKAEIMERFEDMDLGLLSAHTKNEMIGIIVMELQLQGYSYDGKKPQKEQESNELDQMDPMSYARENGLEELEAALGRMEKKQLKTAIKSMGLNQLYGNAGEGKLRAAILEQTKSRLLKGSGFLLG